MLFRSIGHEAFAVEVGGREYYGEIDQIFLENRNDYNVEIISFGWRGEGWVGMPMPGMCATFTMNDIKIAQSIIVQLINAVSRFDKKPSVMRQTDKSHFMGKIAFRDGWALISKPDFEDGVHD